MRVEIKQIAEEKDEVFLLIRCSKPYQKQIPFSNGREEPDTNNKLFEEYAEQYRLRMNEYQKRMLRIHLGETILIRDDETP